MHRFRARADSGPDVVVDDPHDVSLDAVLGEPIEDPANLAVSGLGVS
ncbi:hypothetical protein [Nocardia tengchongensis]